MTRQKHSPADFGERLAAIRKAKGVTQVQLAEMIESTQRAISYYESPRGHAPGPVIAKLAEALDVTADELLGIKPRRRTKPHPRTEVDPRLWKRFLLLTSLPERDQKAVMRMITSLASANGLINRRPKEATTGR
jgi:transcriptional regulator with XRE-family HTH domain